MFYKDLKCKCGEVLEFDNDTDMRVDGTMATMVSHGHCPRCEKKYKWLDYYTLSHWGDLEEDDK